MGEHVAVQVDAWGDLGEQQPGVGEPEHRPLGEVVHLLAAAVGVGPAEGALLQRTDEAPGRAVGEDVQAPVADRDFCAGGEGGHEPDALAFWLMLMNPPGPASLG